MSDERPNSPEGGGHAVKPPRGVWDSPRNVQLMIWTFFGCCAVVFALDFFVHRHASFEHGELPMEMWPGFYAIYGFVACVLLVVLAKIMRRFVMRPETYYGDPSTDPAEGGSAGDQVGGGAGL